MVHQFAVYVKLFKNLAFFENKVCAQGWQKCWFKKIDLFFLLSFYSTPTWMMKLRSGLAKLFVKKNNDYFILILRLYKIIYSMKRELKKIN